MAGKPGRSGGARPGAGRKPKEPVFYSSETLITSDPEAWLTAVMQDASLDLRERKDAAKALLVHQAKKVEAAGNKDAKKKAATEVASNRFQPTAPPKLVAVK